jgi:hypothetical protein
MIKDWGDDGGHWDDVDVAVIGVRVVYKECKLVVV